MDKTKWILKSLRKTVKSIKDEIRDWQEVNLRHCNQGKTGKKAAVKQLNASLIIYREIIATLTTNKN